MSEPGISVVINTLNEERNLPYALRSVRSWADEIVVVDMHSDDRTREIAAEFGAKVFLHERMGFADPARAFAIAQATKEWILMLDADELVTEPLSRRLREIVRENQSDVVLIPWYDYLLGGPLKGTGWSPKYARMTRFFRRGFLRARGEVHNYIEVDPGARTVTLPVREGEWVVHFNCLNLEKFIEKMNRYTTLEARQRHRNGERSCVIRGVLRASREFLYRFVKTGGWRDGWRGWYISLFMAAYAFAREGKIRELETIGEGAQIDEQYRREAERWLRGYPTEGKG